MVADSDFGFSNLSKLNPANKSFNLLKPILGSKYENYQRRDQGSFAERPISQLLDDTDHGHEFEPGNQHHTLNQNQQIDNDYLTKPNPAASKNNR